MTYAFCHCEEALRRSNPVVIDNTRLPRPDQGVGARNDRMRSPMIAILISRHPLADKTPSAMFREYTQDCKIYPITPEGEVTKYYLKIYFLIYDLLYLKAGSH